MIPAVPAPKNGRIPVPIDAKLEPGWHYDAGRREFVSDSGETFQPGRDLPKKTRIVYKVPHVADATKLSQAERDLQRYLQVILPPAEAAADYVQTVRSWPCIADAHVGPEVSLP
jgi:hypothetical protein